MWHKLNIANHLLLISQESLQSAQNLYQSGAADILQLNQVSANLQHAQQKHSQAQALGDIAQGMQRLFADQEKPCSFSASLAF